MNPATIDFNTITPFAALLLVVFLVLRHYFEQSKKKDNFTEAMAKQSMERSYENMIQMQAISTGTVTAMSQSTAAMKELTQAIKDGDDEKIKRLCAIEDMQQTAAEAQIDHEDQAIKRHKELMGS